ncbi:cation diffusion facilitator family transporter [Gemella bergeri ATCC 700627]|uniref:Cation diffusion facilitator family transporter n=1 Tax=Gemella bergeri ATCC 700627 TaxID=1321820 RepID=U2QU52_9BACL|nr:isochorismatase family protein [Gemella bergeri]ERK60046.1 cation diffusion facilitator family transporter [Gemella bergeri ATCC 700627]
MEMLFKLLAEHVYLILFISLILEFAALPLPGETMMLFAGIMAYGGHASYIGMIMAGALGTVIGMQFSYEIGRRLGTKAVDKCGSYIGLTPYRMTKASDFFNKYGNIVIIIAYFLPGVRHIMGYFSGISRVDGKKFHTYSTIGGIFWVVVFISLGYVLGPSAHHAFRLMHRYGSMLIIIGLIALFIYLIYRKLGKKDFSIYFKKRTKFITVLVIIFLTIISYFIIFNSHRHPKLIMSTIFYSLGALAIITFLAYIRVCLKHDTSEKLLVVVDYQKDFVDGALGFETAEKLDEIIVKKIEEYKKSGQDIIFTKDTHYTNYLTTREGKHLPIEHCIIDTDGHGLYGKVANFEKDAKKVFNKTTFGSIDLANYVSRSDYKEVELCGLVSNICVLSNIIMIQNYNEKVELFVDLKATKGIDEDINRTFKKYLEQLTINVIE